MNDQARRSLPDRMRARWSDRQRFLILCVLAGLSCGLVAVAFHLAIEVLFHSLRTFAEGKDPVGFAAILIAAPTLGGLLVGLGVHFWARDAAGSGIPQTKAAYYNEGGRIFLGTGVWRFVLSSLYIGLGNSLGREGPTVHLSAALSSRIGRWAFRDPARVQAMLPVGVAGGIAAAFNAPLSALTFVFEELLDNFSMKALGGMVVAVVVAAAVSRTILGEHPVLTTNLAENYQTSAWMLVALPLGLAAGLLGHLFVRGILRMRGWFREKSPLPGWLAPASGGLACGILGVVGYTLAAGAGEARHSVFSIGYEGLEAAFQNKLTLTVVAALFGLKLLAVMVNYASGGSGGLFSPTLFLGGMLGALAGFGLSEVHHLGDWIPAFPNDSKVIGGCVLLGMGAMFAAVIRCPFTSLIIIFEMTGSYSLILPLMVGNMLAWRLARALQPVGIYNALLLQDGVTLRSMPAYRGSVDYRELPVQAIMTHDVYSLEDDVCLAEALHRLKREKKPYHAYPVLDARGDLAGVITLHELREHPPEMLVADVIRDQKLLTVHRDTSIRASAHAMVARDFQQCPVVAPDNPRKLVGWITMNDIVRQQNALE